jgi:hypothetical protein
VLQIVPSRSLSVSNWDMFIVSAPALDVKIVNVVPVKHAVISGVRRPNANHGLNRRQRDLGASDGVEEVQAKAQESSSAVTSQPFGGPHHVAAAERWRRCAGPPWWRRGRRRSRRCTGFGRGSRARSGGARTAE